MGRTLWQGLTDPKKPESIVHQLKRVQDVVNGEVSFGSPQDPRDPQSTEVAGFPSAGSEIHHGTLENVQGSWVEVLLTATGITDVEVTHNLYLNNDLAAVPVSNQPNVRWMTWGIMHDGTGSDPTTYLVPRIGEPQFLGTQHTVNVNSIELRFQFTFAGAIPTVDATHPIRWTLFFIPAVRGE